MEFYLFDPNESAGSSKFLVMSIINSSTDRKPTEPICGDGAGIAEEVRSPSAVSYGKK